MEFPRTHFYQHYYKQDFFVLFTLLLNLQVSTVCLYFRAYDKDADAPIIFTKSAPEPRYQERVMPLENDDDAPFGPNVPLPLQR